MHAHKKWTLLLAASLCLMYAYFHRHTLMDILTVVLLSAGFCMLLSPLCTRLEKKSFSPSAAAVLSIVLLMLVIILCISVFVPYLIGHSIRLIRRSTPVLSGLFQYVSQWADQPLLRGLQQPGAGEVIAGLMTSLTSCVTRIGLSIASMTGKVFFSLVISYYLLKDRRTVCAHLLLLIPLNGRRNTLSMLHGCANSMLSYLSGIGKTSLFVAAATYTALLFLKIPDAFLLAVFMGILEILPYAGPVLAAIPIVLSSLPLGLEHTLLTIGILVAIQQAESSFVSPYFTASSTSLHPLCVLTSVFVFGSLMGLWGILIAVPAVILIRSVLWSVRQMCAVKR